MQGFDFNLEDLLNFSPQVEEILPDEERPSLDDARDELDMLVALTRGPAWDLYRKLIVAQFHNRVSSVLFSYIGEAGLPNTHHQEKLKGEAAGLQLSVKLLELRIERLREIIDEYTQEQEDGVSEGE